MSNRILFFDIFTTQNDLYGKNNCPIQFTCEEFSEEDLYIREKFLLHPEKRTSFNIIPDEDISIAGYITSGIRTSDVNTSDFNGFALKDAMKKIYDILSNAKNKGYYIAGFNHVNYDLKILNSTFSRVLIDVDPIIFDDDKIIDVMKFSESVISVDKCGSYSMDSLFIYLFNDLNRLNAFRQRKSTITDILITKMVLLKLLMTIEKGKRFSCEEIVNTSRDLETKNDIMNFGKYKGMSLKDVFELDSQYLTWISNNKSFKEQNPVLVDKIKNMLNNTII